MWFQTARTSLKELHMMLGIFSICVTQTLFLCTPNCLHPSHFRLCLDPNSIHFISGLGNRTRTWAGSDYYLSFLKTRAKLNDIIFLERKSRPRQKRSSWHLKRLHTAALRKETQSPIRVDSDLCARWNVCHAQLQGLSKLSLFFPVVWSSNLYL